MLINLFFIFVSCSSSPKVLTCLARIEPAHVMNGTGQLCDSGMYRGAYSQTGARAEAWCLLIPAEASLSFVFSHRLQLRDYMRAQRLKDSGLILKMPAQGAGHRGLLPLPPPQCARGAPGVHT